MGRFEPAHEEPKHVMRSFDRLTFDTCRLAQMGGWWGTLELPAKTVTMSPERGGAGGPPWRAAVGEPEPPGIGITAPMSTFYWNYAPMRFPGFSLFYIAQETRRNTRVEEALRVWDDGRLEHLGTPEHELAFISGTRIVRATAFAWATCGRRRADAAVPPRHRHRLRLRPGLAAWHVPGPVGRAGCELRPRQARGRGAHDRHRRQRGAFPAADGTIGYGLWEYF